jgi:HD-like signal output (HDOD) protein
MFSFLRNRIDPKARLQEVLRGYELPSFPGVITETLRQIRDPQAYGSSIAEVLSADPGLSVQVLRLANSAAFSRVKKVENLTQAIALIGFSQLEGIVLSVGISRGMPAKSTLGFEPTRFWRTSARRGVLAQALASILCPARNSECFTAGFLQDMALPFLATRNSETYDPILRHWHDEGGSLVELERSTFGWDHAEVATWMCHEWDFPEGIAAAIGCHHGTCYEEYEPPAPVSLVSQLRETDNTLGLDGLIEEARSRFSIPPGELERLAESSFKDAEALARLML